MNVGRNEPCYCGSGKKYKKCCLQKKPEPIVSAEVDELYGVYDPLVGPTAEEWLALDEDARLQIIIRHHEKEKIALPNVRVHAAMHAVIENQIADNDPEATAKTLRRLIEEGLDRHDAVHAIAQIVAEKIYNIAKSKESFDLEEYEQKLNALTAKEWLNQDF